jgi:hypothetical protein
LTNLAALGVSKLATRGSRLDGCPKVEVHEVPPYE